MKKYICFILVFGLLFTSVGCGKGYNEILDPAEENPPEQTTATSPTQEATTTLPNNPTAIDTTLEVTTPTRKVNTPTKETGYEEYVPILLIDDFEDGDLCSNIKDLTNGSFSGTWINHFLVNGLSVVPRNSGGKCLQYKDDSPSYLAPGIATLGGFQTYISFIGEHSELGGRVFKYHDLFNRDGNKYLKFEYLASGIPFTLILCGSEQGVRIRYEGNQVQSANWITDIIPLPADMFASGECGTNLMISFGEMQVTTEAERAELLTVIRQPFYLDNIMIIGR